jgi:orotidine-5'-phosphate decarboxylase
MLARNPVTAEAQTQDSIPLRDRLIVALDVPTVEKARAIVEELGDEVVFYKIGMQLQFANGLQFAEELIKKHKKVFLDSKLLDIEQTIEGAVENIAKMGVTFLTVHGNGKTIRSAVSARRGSDLKILSVTVLTNLDAHDLKDLYGDDFKFDVADLVRRRALKAFEAGADGVIASGQEAKMIKEIAGDGLKIITPGIRPDGSELNEQKRAMTPCAAIEAGADYLVVGRPITQASDRRAVVKQIFEEISQGLASR